MTPAQRVALDFITAYIERNRISPSREEIQTALGLSSKSGAHRLVMGLVRGGFLTIDGKYRSRGLKLVQATCPHCGKELAQ